MFDRDKTGSIATNMMSTILRTLGQTFEESDLEILISEIDADGMINNDVAFTRQHSFHTESFSSSLPPLP